MSGALYSLGETAVRGDALAMQIQFENVSDFLTMSGHGMYVWIAVFFSLTMLIALILFPLYVHAKVSKESRIDQHKTTAPLGGEGSG